MAHPKGVLLERAAKLGFERPEFRTERTGPQHEPQFLSDVIVGGEVLGTGQGGSKRTAETRAAEEALAQLDERADKVGNDRAGGKPGGKTRGSAASKQAAKGSAKEPAKAAAQSSTARTTKRQDQAAPATAGAAQDEESGTMAGNAAESDDEFDGPWPLFDDLLAAVLQVAERRVSADLRGEEAREAIRDFSLDLYKDLLSDLGEVVEDDEDEDEEEDDD